MSVLPVVAIVGRPNVGKSTLFNRLVGGRRALVADQAGLTRDRHYDLVRRADRPFFLVDTGGLVPGTEDSLESEIARQAQVAMEEAVLTLFVVDARDGLTAGDYHIAQSLRRSGRQVILVANKVDGPRQRAELGEFYQLGLPTICPISAEHGIGSDELLETIDAALPRDRATLPERESGVRLALVGRPNAGKSMLLNRLAGSDRAIVSDEPGTTRDPIDIRVDCKHGVLTVVDTAGIRRRRRADTPLEQLAVLRAHRSIVAADVACLVIDASTGPTQQDARIANAALDAGRALVLTLSKCDLLTGTSRQQLLQQMDDRLHFVDYADRIFLSALTGKGVGRLLPAIWRAHGSWTRRVETAPLNRFLEQVQAAHAPPASRGRSTRLYFVSQPTSRPPTFVFSTNTSGGIQVAYGRYLARKLRERFDFGGTPLRLVFRKRGKQTQDTG